MKIYKSKFLGNSKIPVILDTIYDDIKKAYTGGAVDVYNPSFGFDPKSSCNEVDSFISKNKDNPKGYYYDVNSLYPYVMKENPMPVGNPVFFEGNILKAPYQELQLMEIKNNSKPFGIFEVEVETPCDLQNPILQVKHKTEFGGFRTIAPLGN
jgi:DNA polymerase type B, organellar and viral